MCCSGDILENLLELSHTPQNAWQRHWKQAPLLVTLLRCFHGLLLSSSIEMPMAFPITGRQGAELVSLTVWKMPRSYSTVIQKHQHKSYQQTFKIPAELGRWCLKWCCKENRKQMLSIYLSNALSTSAPNALQIIGRSVWLPLERILVWGRAEQDNKHCGSRRSQELTNVFHWKWRKKSKGKAFVAELKLAEIRLVFVQSAISTRNNKISQRVS